MPAKVLASGCEYSRSRPLPQGSLPQRPPGVATTGRKIQYGTLLDIEAAELGKNQINEIKRKLVARMGKPQPFHR